MRGLGAAALGLLATFNLQSLTCSAQGSLTPPGLPASTMKMLAQIEPRTAIINAGVVASSPAGPVI